MQRCILASAFTLLLLFSSSDVSLAFDTPDDNSLSWLDGFNLVVLETTDIPSLHQARELIHSQGGSIAVMVPPSFMMGWIPPEIDNALVGRRGIKAIYRGEVSAGDLSVEDRRAEMLITSYNRIVSGEAQSEYFARGQRVRETLTFPDDNLTRPPFREEGYLDNLRRMGADLFELEERGLLLAESAQRSGGQSERMTGTVALSLFFVESDGSVDPNVYDWDEESVQIYLDGVMMGLAWWSSRSANYPPAGVVTFVPHVHHYPPSDPRCNQGMEPVTRPSTDHVYWVDSVMTNFGYTSGSVFEKVDAFNTIQRDTCGTDWAYCAFIACNDGPGAPVEFTDGRSAFAYRGGPYAVCLYQSSFSYPQEHFAHETGHIFNACDEYHGCGPYCCNCVENGNCVEINPYSVGCMMKYTTFELCRFTPWHLGWFDGSAPCSASMQDPIVNVYNETNDWLQEAHSSAPVDTYLLADYSFDSPGACADEGWTTAVIGADYGGFAALFSGASVVQADACRTDLGCLWGFFGGSTDYYVCATPDPWPSQPIVPHSDADGLSLREEIVSPVIEWNPGGTIPSTVSGATLEFSVYLDLPIENLVFYVWHVRCSVGGVWETWKDVGFVYYGGNGSGWVDFRQDIGALISTGATHVQLALGCWDMYRLWDGILGTGLCHSHAPLFDKVRFYRTGTTGPVWSVRDIDLFQDAFPEDGSLTGIVQTSAARGGPYGSESGPASWVEVTVNEPNHGLGVDETHGKAAVYCHVRCSDQSKYFDNYSADPSKWPQVGIGLFGHTYLMDTLYTADGDPVENRYCFDLRDDLFTPPDRIDFYFSARDAEDVTTYWSQGSGTTKNQLEVMHNPMEMQCLPTPESDFLYVDDFDNRGAQPYFDTAFEQLGITPDRFDVRGPSSLMENGLAAHAQPQQIIDTYKTIIWNAGDLSVGTVEDTTMRLKPLVSDAELLCQFLDSTSVHDPGLYLTGDNIAQEMATTPSGSYAMLRTHINYQLTSGSHVLAGHQVSPLVIGSSSAGIFYDLLTLWPDTLVAFGGCPIINDFDVLTPGDNAVTAMYYDPVPTAGAVIAQSTINAKGATARVLLSGFSYHSIRDDRTLSPFDRLVHLHHALVFLGNNLETPTAVLDKPAYRNDLAQNYPNPFNPATSIEYSIQARGHVSLKIYNVAGQLVSTLVDEVVTPQPNRFVAVWDGTNDAGQGVATGVYFCRLVTKDFTKTIKIVLLK